LDSISSGRSEPELRKTRLPLGLKSSPPHPMGRVCPFLLLHFIEHSPLPPRYLRNSELLALTHNTARIVREALPMQPVDLAKLLPKFLSRTLMETANSDATAATVPVEKSRQVSAAQSK
jgi:hypothetical protein